MIYGKFTQSFWSISYRSMVNFFSYMVNHQLMQGKYAFTVTWSVLDTPNNIESMQLPTYTIPFPIHTPIFTLFEIFQSSNTKLKVNIGKLIIWDNLFNYDMLHSWNGKIVERDSIFNFCRWKWKKNFKISKLKYFFDN